MTFTFHELHHRPRQCYWLKWFPILIDPVSLCRRVVFSTESKYNLPGSGDPNGEVYDVNKLYGVSFGFNPKRNSARFGWRYDREQDQFLLYWFCHFNGKMRFELLGPVIMGRYYDLKIIITGVVYRFYVYDDNQKMISYDEVKMGHSKKNGVLLGPYFGGNAKAPQKLSIELKKI